MQSSSQCRTPIIPAACLQVVQAVEHAVKAAEEVHPKPRLLHISLLKEKAACLKGGDQVQAVRRKRQMVGWLPGAADLLTAASYARVLPQGLGQVSHLVGSDLHPRPHGLDRLCCH